MQVACISLGTLGELRGGVDPDDGEPVWSIRDFINTMKQKPIGDKYGTSTWNDMIKGDHQNELVGISYQLVIPGSQGRAAPCANILGLQTILTLLPGKIAETYRKEARDIMNRVITGDKSLIKIIEANASTANPIQTLIRGAMKRGRESENGGAAVEEDPEERRIRFRLMEAEAMKIEAESKKINMETTKDTLKFCEEGYIRNCVGGIIDDRARLRFKDYYLDSIAVNSDQVQSSQGRITNGDEREITITDVAKEIKIKLKHGQETQAGRIMARLYRAKYGENAGKVERHVDGASRMVYGYYRKDIDLMEQAIREAASG